jgi:hypothetical protein
LKLRGKVVWVAVGVAILAGVAFVPALTATMSPSTAPTVAADPVNAPCATTSGHLPPGPSVAASSDPSWSYGGQGWWNFSYNFDGTTVTYNSSFGWTVNFTVTQTSPGIWSLEEQRMLGITILKNVTNPKVTWIYCYHSQENDAAFANITNGSTVYVNGQPVPALGIVNASAAAASSIDQTLSIMNATETRQASLSVMATANASVMFTPSLGLIPLNLTGIWQWNSSAVANYGAGWTFSYAYTELNGTSGSHSKSGSLGGSATVNVSGHRVAPFHAFSDHKTRLGVVLMVQGPFSAYDGFILVPHSFDPFGTAVHAYDPYGFGSAGVSSEVLYLSPGPGGFAITAADQTFDSADSVGLAQAATGPGPDAMSTPGTTVYGEPISAAEAHAIDHGLASGGFAGGSAGSAAASAGASLSGLLVAVAVVGAIVVGCLAGVLGWRAYARRR